MMQQGWNARGQRPTAAAALVALALGAAAGGCDGGAENPNAALVRRGETVYQTTCTACHARDPGQKGPVGPAIAGSSLELLESKVLRNEYPPGYTPKRDTQAMVPLVHVEKDLPAVHAYLDRAAP